MVADLRILRAGPVAAVSVVNTLAWNAGVDVMEEVRR
jgi:hypothetical protein